MSHFGFNFQPGPQVHWMRDDFDNLSASVTFTVHSALLEIRSECTVATARLTTDVRVQRQP